KQLYKRRPVEQASEDFLTKGILPVPLKIEVKDRFPRPISTRPALDLRQVQATRRELPEAIVECSRLIPCGENERRFVVITLWGRFMTQNKKSREVERDIFNFKHQRIKAV